MRILWAIVFVVLMAVSSPRAGASDSLRTADSLRDARTQMPLWSDTSFAHSDSLAGGRRAYDRWLMPLGVIVLTGLSAWLLYSTRSK